MNEPAPVGWELKIEGHPAALQWLERKTVAGSPRLTTVGDSYRLEWDGLRSFAFAQVQEVESQAQEYLTALAGLASIFRGLHANLCLADVSYRRPDGGRNSIVSMHETIRISATAEAEMTVMGPDGLPKRVADSDPTAKLLALAHVDDVVAKVLRLANADLHDWGDLYRLWEVLQHAAGGTEGLSTMSGVSKTRISWFTRTANSPDLIGDAARHGVQSGSAPAEPMPMGEAVDMLRKIARAWLTWRAS